MCFDITLFHMVDSGKELDMESLIIILLDENLPKR
jgi:hypothetical protein